MFKRLLGSEKNKMPDSVVLIVSDDADTSATVCETLSDQGYEVHAANTVEDAIKILDEIEIPDLMIGDFVNPEVDGKAFLTRAEIRIGKPDLPPVMFLMDAEDDETAAHDLGAHDLCQKPIDPEQFLECVERAIMSRRAPIE